MIWRKTKKHQEAGNEPMTPTTEPKPIEEGDDDLHIISKLISKMKT